MIPLIETVDTGHLAIRSLSRSVYRRFLLLECLAFASAVAFLMFMLRDVLFTGRATFTHDTVLWVYPIFTYLADGLLHGQLPLWNPFSRGGEPLLPSYLQTRLFDPIDHLVVYVGSLFTGDLTTLFNWDRFMRLLAAALGTHLLIRRWAKHPVTRIVLAFIAVLSSMSINIFHQTGFNDQYYCAPFVALFLFRILEGKHGWPNWFGGLFFLGSSLQSYFFVGTLTLALTILAGYALFRRKQLVALLVDRQSWLKIAASIVFLAIMSGPSLIMLLQQKDFHMSARSVPAIMADDGGGTLPQASPDSATANGSLISMPYRFVRLTGTPVRPADFLGLLAPGANDSKTENGNNPVTRVVFGITSSDARMFFGGLAFAVSLLGIALARTPFKRIWLLILGFFGLLMLGPYTPFHAVLFQVYPPLWVIRHTQQLLNFFLLALLFFFVVGSDYVLVSQRQLKPFPPVANLYWWRDPAPMPRLKGLIERYQALWSVLAAILAALAVFKAHELVAPHLADAPSAFIGILVVVVTMLLVLSVIENFAAKREPSRHGTTARLSSVVRTCRFPALVALSVVVLLQVYSDGDSQSAHVGFKPSFYLNALALFAVIRLLPVVADYFLSIRRPPPGQPVPTRADWWHVSRSQSYWRFRTFTLNNQLALALVVLVVCLVIAAHANETWRLPYAFRVNFLTMFGQNFERCVTALALLGVAQLATAVAILRSPSLGLRIAQISVGFVASAISIYIFVALPNPDTGWGVERVSVQGGRAEVRPDLNFLLVISSLVAVNLVTAAAVFKRLAPMVLVVAMTFVGIMAVVTPGIFLAHVALFVVLPLMSFWLLRRYRPHWRREFVAASLILVTAFELGQLAREYRPEVTVPRSSVKKDWPAAVGDPAFPAIRVAAISQPPFSDESLQVVRFSELLARQGVALETPLSYPAAPFVADAAHLLGRPRWNTFFSLNSYNALLRGRLDPQVVESIFGIGAPIVQFRPSARVTGDFSAEILAMKPEERRSLLQATVFLDRASLPAGWQAPRSPDPRGQDPRTTVTVRSLDYDGLSVVVHSPQPGFIYFADAFTHDWTATVNGVAVPVLRANGYFKAVEVGTGVSVVQFVYRPLLLIWSLRLFFGGLALAALVMVAGFVFELSSRRATPFRHLAPRTP